MDSSAPLKHAWQTSWKATARGTTSDMPRVSGLGPREVPNAAWRGRVEVDVASEWGEPDLEDKSKSVKLTHWR